MKNINYLTVLFLLTGLFSCNKEQKIPSNPTAHVIPKPLETSVKEGSFTLKSSTKVYYADEALFEVAMFLAEKIETSIGFKLKSEKKESAKKGILLTKGASADLGEEGYTFSITPKLITISGVTDKGVFYGIQTLRQLFPPEFESNDVVAGIDWTLPCVEIRDKPRFVYRGGMLDVCRHIFPIEFIKKYIDNLARYKINTFHWHLTEDQGWRLDIEKYPRLREVAAYRDETLAGHHSDRPVRYDGKRYGGFYTREQAEDIVEYARKRFVTIIPEIELPGHSIAALAAYPELGCTGGPYKVRTTWGVEEDVYCAGNEKTFAFLEDVLREVMEIFPSKYIHIGGDECPKRRWEKCPKCQGRIKKEGLNDEDELQSYFIRRIEKFLSSNGRKLIGWDEILEGGLAPNATVMSWRGMEGGIEAARQGHDVIMTPVDVCYLNLHQVKDTKNEPIAFGGYTPLEKVYNFDPVPRELTGKEAKHVLGTQANVWTEYIKTPEVCEYMVFPRICALAEVAWSSKEKLDYSDFLIRLEPEYKRLELLKVKYRRPE